ncbi:MAG: hypothetical protein H7X86_11855 [Gorillibacterium sp.]|nr:hypothetical protein [Gorillibacterium sp.]
MENRSISRDSTIYNYTLIRKINVRIPFVGLYGLSLAIAATLAGQHYGEQGLKALLASFVTIPLLHYIIVRLSIFFTDEVHLHEWSFCLLLPWFGYQPVGYVSFSKYCNLLHQTFWIGTAAACLGYVWVPQVYTLAFIFTHLWLILPRYVVFIRFRKLKAGGLLRFSHKDASYYLT